jgi:putative nucleotidyltransferase with HDIG domain
MRIDGWGWVGRVAGIASAAACGIAPAAELAAEQSFVSPAATAGLTGWWTALAAAVVAAVLLMRRLAVRRFGDEDAPPLPPIAPDLEVLLLALQDPAVRGDRPVAEVLASLVATAHSRDAETVSHSFRVARYAVALAHQVGLAGATMESIEWGALLHDIGKSVVPDQVLGKEGPLDDAEMAIIREHPRQGYQMLRGLLFLGTALDVVLSHHERWDGRGYPNGLAGVEIPLAARIFAVVDTYDAITSDRPYRLSRSHAEAADELMRVSGSQLDPRLVRTFLAIPPGELDRMRDLSRPVDSGLDATCHRLALSPAQVAADQAREARL